MAELIRSPAGRNSHRAPDPTVRRFFRPHAVIVQVLIAHRSSRHVARRQGSIQPLVASRAPAIETVVRRRFCNFMVQRSLIGKANLLIGTNANSWALSGGIAFTLADSHHGRVAVGIDIKAIIA
jgi:hypothetical protein